jgi:hypothetical protein
MTIPTSALSGQDVTGNALLLALVAVQLRTAWHAGAVDADTAMRSLDRVVAEICSLRAMKHNSAKVPSSGQGPLTQRAHEERRG